MLKAIKVVLLALGIAGFCFAVAVNAQPDLQPTTVVAVIVSLLVGFTISFIVHYESETSKEWAAQDEERRVRELAREVAKPLEELIADAEKKAVEEFEYDYGLKPEPKPRLPNPFREPEWKI